MAVTIYYNGNDVTDTSVQIPLGTTAIFTAVTSGESIDRWFSSTSNDSIYTMTYSGATCTVTPVAVGVAPYGIYCWPASGSSAHIGIEVVDESGDGDSGSTATVSQIFCDYNKTTYGDGETINVTTGTTLSLRALVMMSDGSVDSNGVYWMWIGGDYGYLEKNSSTATTASYTAVNAGTQQIALQSKTDTSKFITITIVVTGSSTKEIDHIFVIHNGSGYTSNFTIEANVGDSFSLSAYAEYSDGAIDSAQGVDFVFITGQEVISCDSETTSDLTCTACEAGTTVITIMSNRTPTVFFEVTVVVTAASTTVGSVEATYGGSAYSSDFSINAKVGDSLSFMFYALFDDGTSIDDSEGVGYGRYSADDVIWSITTNNTTYGVLQLTLLITAAGTARLKVYSKRDPAKSIIVTITATANSTPTGVRVYRNDDDSDHYDDFQIDISMDSSAIAISVVSIYSDNSVKYNGAYKLMSGSSYVTITEHASDVWSIQPKAVGKGLIKAYCTDDESKYIIITINVYDDTTATGGYSCHIYTGSAWEEYKPYIYNGNTWEEYVSDICSGSAWTLDE